MQHNLIIDEEDQGEQYDYNDNDHYEENKAYEYNQKDDEEQLKHLEEIESNENDDIVNQYKFKIQNQASRLQELQLYIQLCEKKIASVEPNQHFPIKPSDINSNSNNAHQSYKEFLQFLSQNKYESFRYFIIDYSKLTNDLFKQNKLIEELQLNNKSLSSMTNQNNELKDLTEKLKNDLTQLSNQYFSLQEETINLKNELVKINELKEEYNQLESAYETLQSCNHQLTKEKKALITQSSFFKNQLSQNNTNLYNYISQSTSNHYKEKEEIEKKASKEIKSKFELKYIKLRSDLELKTKEIDILNAKLLQTENELQSTQSALYQLTPKCNSISYELSNLKEINSDLNKESSQSILKLSNANEIIEIQLNKTKVELNELKKAYNAIILKYNTIANDCEIMSSYYNNLKDNNNKLKDSSQSKERLCLQYEISMRQLSDELNKLQLSYQKDSNMNNDLIDKLKNENSLLILGIEKMQIDMNKNNKDIAAKNNMINDLELRVSSKENANESNANYIKDLESKINELNETNKRLQQENQKIIEGMIDKKIIETNISLDKDNLVNANHTLNNDLIKEQNLNKEIERLLDQLFKNMKNGGIRLLDSISEYNMNDYYNKAFISFLTQSALAAIVNDKDMNDIIKLILSFITFSFDQFIDLNRALNENRLTILILKEKMESKSKLVNNITDKKAELQSQYEKLTKNHTNQAEKSNDLLKEILILQNEVKNQNDQQIKLDNSGRNKDNAIRLLSIELKVSKDNMMLYETILPLLEEIIIEMSFSFINNPHVKTLSQNLIQSNYDLFELQRDLSQLLIDQAKSHFSDNELNEAIINKINIKELEVKELHSSILNDIHIETQLLYNQKCNDFNYLNALA